MSWFRWRCPIRGFRFFADIETGDKRHKPFARIAGLALLLVLFALLTFGARQNSLTFDEPSHLTAGYAFLARGADWTVPLRGHPLLVNAWEALPLYLGDPDIPLETLDGWDEDYLRYVEAFSPYLVRNLEQVTAAARALAILLTLLLAAVVCRWGSDLGGAWVGLLALGVMVFDPTLLAHGRLATNDVAVTALGTLALYIILRWTQLPNWSRTVAVGSVLGLAALTKGSGVLWAGVGLGWALWVGLRQRDRRGHMLRQALAMGIISFLMLWGVYRFTVGMVPGWSEIPVPAPRHWLGVLFQAEHLDKPIVYALGEWRPTGWPWFFPLAFLIKNPLPLLMGALLGMGALARERQWWAKLGILILFCGLYVLIAIIMGPNLGYRHMIPVHPLLYLLVAAGVGWIWPRVHLIGRTVIVVLGIWTVVSTMRIYPYNLAFFNELAGGPTNGWRYLEGSNTDWGQGWEALRDFREERALTYSYSGPDGYARTVSYDLWDNPLPPLHFVTEALFRPWLFPEPGDYVLSANTLSGSFLVDPDNFGWFRYHEPDAVIAQTLFYYHVDAANAPKWLAQCTVPAVPLDEEAVAEGFGEIDLRSIAFDCSQSWVYPEGGATRGVYTLHGGLLLPETLQERLHLAPAKPEDTFAARHLEGVPQGHRQWESRALPAFALFEWQGGPVPTPRVSQAGVAAADTPPAALESALVHTTPVPLAGPLTFLGVNANSQGDTLELETWWQVTEGPITRPLSVMAHLLDGDGAMLGVADGFGAALWTLVPGDVVVQRHRFPVPTEGTDIWLRTGAYWLDNGERWAMTGVPGADALFVSMEIR